MANLFRGGRKKTNDIIISWSEYYKTFSAFSSKSSFGG
jgi:hypothetical protein